MKRIILTLFISTTLIACSEEQRPAVQAKHALYSAQYAADQAAQHAQDMADKAQKMLDNQ